MKNEDFEKIQNNISQKLGNEKFALISDDIATLMTENNNMNTQISEHNKTIDKLKQDKEMLLETNGNLMQKISVGFKEDFTPPTQPEEKKYNMSDAFDEKGNFK